MNDFQGLDGCLFSWDIFWDISSDIGHSSRGTHWSLLESYPRLKRGSDVEMSYGLSFEKLLLPSAVHILLEAIS